MVVLARQFVADATSLLTVMVRSASPVQIPRVVVTVLRGLQVHRVPLVHKVHKDLRARKAHRVNAALSTGALRPSRESSMRVGLDAGRALVGSKPAEGLDQRGSEGAALAGGVSVN